MVTCGQVSLRWWGDAGSLKEELRGPEEGYFGIYPLCVCVQDGRSSNKELWGLLWGWVGACLLLLFFPGRLWWAAQLCRKTLAWLCEGLRPSPSCRCCLRSCFCWFDLDSSRVSCCAKASKLNKQLQSCSTRGGGSWEYNQLRGMWGRILGMGNAGQIPALVLVQGAETSISPGAVQQSTGTNEQ